MSTEAHHKFQIHDRIKVLKDEWVAQIGGEGTILEYFPEGVFHFKVRLDRNSTLRNYRDTDIELIGRETHE